MTRVCVPASKFVEVGSLLRLFSIHLYRASVFALARVMPMYSALMSIGRAWRVQVGGWECGAVR
jgi:hypothetical protein